MSEVTKQQEYAALAELKQRRQSGEIRLDIPPAVLHQLEHQRLVEPDDNGELRINARGEERLRHLLQANITHQKNWRLGR